MGVLQPGQGLVLTLMVTLLGSAPDHRALEPVLCTVDCTDVHSPGCQAGHLAGHRLTSLLGLGVITRGQTRAEVRSLATGVNILPNATKIKK